MVKDSRPENRENTILKDASTLELLYELGRGVGHKVLDAGKGFAELCRTTSIEIVLGATIGLGGGALYSHSVETDREYNAQLAFSEISQMLDKADMKGVELEPHVLYLATANDEFMKIFESHNHSGREEAAGDQLTRFAREIGERMYSQRFRHNLRDLNDVLGARAVATFEEIRDWREAKGSAVPVDSLFSQSWDYDYYDEEYEVCTPQYDSEGNYTGDSCTTYCDYRIHTFKYFPNKGKEALTSLEAYVENNQGLEVPRPSILPDHVGRENEEAIRGTREEEMTPEQVEEAMLTWYFGSTFFNEIRGASNNNTRLHQSLPAWQRQVNSAKTREYKDEWCTSHSGPTEYQTAMSIAANASNMTRSIGRIESGIHASIDVSKRMEKIATGLVNAQLEGREGDPQKLADELMDMSRNGYEKNFQAGHDVQGYRWYMPVLLGLAGGAAGGLLGFGIDRLTGNRRRRYPY